MIEGEAVEPPAGAFRIDRDGVWLHEGREVTHPGVLQNLFANLARDADGHCLRLGPRRIPVEVDDTPFVVVRLEIPEIQADRIEPITLVLSDGSREPLDPRSLWIGPGNVPYCRVKGGTFEARVSLPAWLQLAERIEEDAAGEPVLVLGRERVRVPRRAPPGMPGLQRSTGSC
ncbi:MAG: DUF1285 domain-containing protein [Candidatus Rokubacteria bacterium]|nr:DUF1285 domain-containing protein [Candidatus Rokubacteria bacterium]